MRLLVTDVTEMTGDTCCVAGWCAQEYRMIRPLLGAVHWPRAMVDALAVRPGTGIHVRPTTRPLTMIGDYPHRSESTSIDPTATRLLDPGPPDWFGPDAPPVAATVADGFGRNLAWNSAWDGCWQGVHVAAECRTHSLSAVAVPAAAVRFVESFGKLRMELHDESGGYRLPVSSRTLKAVWRDSGLDAVRRLVPREGRLHVRLGLARAWGDQPEKCYLMVNGVLW